jgi:hypothetical protein
MSLITASGASAAVEVGSNCLGANTPGAGYTLVPTAQMSENPLALTAPSAGVVTRWKSLSGISMSIPERLKVMRPGNSPKSFSVVGESNYQNVAPGPNSFATRIPVQAGDRFGLYSPPPDGNSIYCGTGNPGDKIGYVEYDLRREAGAEFSELAGAAVPVVAVIEPDKDGDGYGDESQDGCPQSAAYQESCPTITLDSFPIVLKRSVLVLVGASEASWVRVFGQVGWRPRHKGGALVSKTKRADHIGKGVIVGLSGGTALAKPGEVAPFNVKLPKSVTRHLSQMTPKQVVKGTITAQATDLAGRVVEHTITIRLHGRGAIHSAGAPLSAGTAANRDIRRRACRPPAVATLPG